MIVWKDPHWILVYLLCHTSHGLITIHLFQNLFTFVLTLWSVWTEQHFLIVIWYKIFHSHVIKNNSRHAINYPWKRIKLVLFIKRYSQWEIWHVPEKLSYEGSMQLQTKCVWMNNFSGYTLEIYFGVLVSGNFNNWMLTPPP